MFDKVAGAGVGENIDEKTERSLKLSHLHWHLTLWHLTHNHASLCYTVKVRCSLLWDVSSLLSKIGRIYLWKLLFLLFCHLNLKYSNHNLIKTIWYFTEDFMLWASSRGFIQWPTKSNWLHWCIGLLMFKVYYCIVCLSTINYKVKS